MWTLARRSDETWFLKGFEIHRAIDSRWLTSGKATRGLEIRGKRTFDDELEETRGKGRREKVKGILVGKTLNTHLASTFYPSNAFCRADNTVNRIPECLALTTFIYAALIKNFTGAPHAAGRLTRAPCLNMQKAFAVPINRCKTMPLGYLSASGIFLPSLTVI